MLILIFQCKLYLGLLCVHARSFANIRMRFIFESCNHVCLYVDVLTKGYDFYEPGLLVDGSFVTEPIEN